jgi:hypothetical protein
VHLAQTLAPVISGKSYHGPTPLVDYGSPPLPTGGSSTYAQDALGMAHRVPVPPFRSRELLFLDPVARPGSARPSSILGIGQCALVE